MLYENLVTSSHVQHINCREFHYSEGQNETIMKIINRKGQWTCVVLQFVYVENFMHFMAYTLCRILRFQQY